MTTYNYTITSKSGTMYRGTLQDDWDRPVEEISRIIIQDSCKDAQIVKVPWDPFNMKLILVRARSVPEPKKETLYAICPICFKEFAKSFLPDHMTINHL